MLCAFRLRGLRWRVESSHPGGENHGTPKPSDSVEVPVDCHGDKSAIVKSALEKAGATQLRADEDPTGW
jgi:hypothetical protein